AGDELSDRSTSTLIATGYYRLGIWDDEPADPEQAYYDSLDDVVATTGMVFLGTSMGCARCHDHKIDPIPQADYYRMLAFFHNIYKDIRVAGFKKTAFTLNTQTEVASPEEIAMHELRMRDHKTQLEQLQAVVSRCEQTVYASFSNPEKEDAADTNVRRQMVRKRAPDVLAPEELQEYEEALRELRRMRNGRVRGTAQALTIKENGREAPETFVLIRGNASAPGEPVAMGFPQILGGGTPEVEPLPDDINSSGRRTLFANWLVDGNNPLAARVIVNRVWQYHFGRGLVRSSSDFGRYGDAPTHPELLDYLATELIRHDWQLKWLHKFILTSRAYRMSSADNGVALDVDPMNNLMWRFEMRRLSSEELRDTVLTVTGQLNAKMHGPSVYSQIPDEVLQSSSRPEDAWGKSAPADQVRRTVYVFVKRSIADPVLSSFDSADTDASCPVRFSTTVPTQALTTLNGRFFNDQAQRLAERLHREGHHDERDFVKAAIELATCRPVEPAEVARGTQLIHDWQAKDNVSRADAERFFCLLTLNLNELIYLD
ncbi:MAG: DUF1553 domain-containing protein, partial [Planctomycetales bacterium]|nr:DUF1553 domain-containing protein [Planctomycetales bacterium]